jgi:hypothetical protein
MRAGLLAFVACLCAGCSWFGASDVDAGGLRELPVVADDGPFDPAQAVDDDDDLERPWLRGADEQEADAFAGEEAVDGSAPRDASAGAAARAVPTDAVASEADARGAPRDAARRDATRRDAGAKPPPDLPSDEHVASPAEVEQLLTSRRQRLAAAIAANGDDDGKLAVARNPPPEPVGDPRPVAWTVRDYTLEAVLLAIVAAACAGLYLLARRYPRATLAAAAAAGAALAVVFLTQRD